MAFPAPASTSSSGFTGPIPLPRDARGRRRPTPKALGPLPQAWPERVEVQLARLEGRLASLEAELSALHGAWPAALVLLRKLVRELEGVAREVAESRLILRDSPEPMAKQNRGDLLSTPSLLRGREASPSPAFP
ncbi:hypothetical protein, partial [Thermus sp.]|uniref:hypothetical protein n=1 Tax=Thermus sp. TaxID=275 RepID=UPI00262F77A3